MAVIIKRVYEPASARDGLRVLVDRLWPRGLTKQRAAIDAWLRDLAPSDALRKWFHAHETEWSNFRKRYLKELAEPQAQEALNKLYALAHEKSSIALLFASKNEDRNNATVLRDLLNGVRKPPTGTGPAGARAARVRQARRMPRH